MRDRPPLHLNTCVDCISELYVLLLQDKLPQTLSCAGENVTVHTGRLQLSMALKKTKWFKFFVSVGSSVKHKKNSALLLKRFIFSLNVC